MVEKKRKAAKKAKPTPCEPERTEQTERDLYERVKVANNEVAGVGEQLGPGQTDQYERTSDGGIKLTPVRKSAF